MRTPQLADQRLDVRVQLAGLETWPVRMVSQPGQPFLPVFTQPQVHGLAGDTVAPGDLGDRRSREDFHDRVIALLHDAQLHEHGPATLRRELGHDGACPGGRRQASDEAAVSTISRSRTPSTRIPVTTFSTVSRARLRRAMRGPSPRKETESRRREVPKRNA